MKSKFENFQSDRSVYVRRRVGERATSTCIMPAIKLRGGSVMVWTAFNNYEVGDLQQVKGKLNQINYASILLHHPIPSGTQLRVTEFVLKRDNNPKHISWLCQRYIKTKEPHVLWLMYWPAQSADSYSIELVWGELDWKIRSKQLTTTYK